MNSSNHLSNELLSAEEIKDTTGVNPWSFIINGQARVVKN